MNNTIWNKKLDPEEIKSDVKQPEKILDKPLDDKNKKLTSIKSLMLNENNRTVFQSLTLEELRLNYRAISNVNEHNKLWIRENKFLEIDDSYQITRTFNSYMYYGYCRNDITDFIIHLT